MHHRDLKLFAPNAGRAYGEAVGRALGQPLAAHEEREFEDGEHKARPLENVRDCDVFVVQSLYGDAGHSADDKLLRLLFLVGALKDASAARVTVVAPYLAYSRKDQKSKARDPVTTRYVAALFEAVGADCMVTLDVHNLAAYQNAFRCRAEHLEAGPLFVRTLAPATARRGPGRRVAGRRRHQAGGRVPHAPRGGARASGRHGVRREVPQRGRAANAMPTGRPSARRGARETRRPA